MKREICAAKKQNKTRKKDGVITALFYLFDFSCFRVGKVKKKSHYLLVIGAVGTAANLLCGSPHRRRVPTRGESEQTVFTNRKYRARPDLSLYLADRDKPCPYGVRKTAVTGTKNMDGD